MKKLRVFSFVAGIMAVAMALTACGGTTSSSAPPSSTASPTSQTAEAEPVTITYCNFSSSGENEETLQKMYEAFHEEYPNITVEIETIGFEDYFTQMQTRIAGGTAPDCYELNIENFSAYANKGVLAEITDVDLSRIDEIALSAFNINGKQYGLPESFSNVVMIYNKELFDQAGLDYPTNDWKHEDVQAAAEAIRALGDEIYGIYQPVTCNELYKVAAQYGGSLLNEDGTQFTINSPENVKAAQMMVDRVLVSNVQPNEAQLAGMGDWDLFMSGRVGMIYTGIWSFATLADGCDFEWDVVVEPGADQKATAFFSNACVINEKSENKEAAATWITWLCSSDAVAQLRINAGWELPAINDKAALASYLEQTPPANRQAVFDSLEYLVLPPTIEDYSLMCDIVDQKLAAATSGSMTVREALDEAQSECEAQISLS